MTAVISKFDYVARIGLIVCLNAFSSARAETNGSVKLDEIGFVFAKELIKKGQIVADGKGAWSEHQPSAAKENEFIRAHGFREYAEWHLGIDRRFPENSKRRYKFPYGDFTNVHRCGLLAVKARAQQYAYVEIQNAAAELEREFELRSTRRIHELNTPKRSPIAAAVIRQIAPQ
jgi:hypothetical protein